MISTTTHVHLGTVLSCTVALALAACGPAANSNDDDNSKTNVTNAQLLDCRSFGEDLTLTDEVEGGVDYIVDCVADVGGELVIEPGVIIQFQQDAGLKIEGSGSITAEGGADAPIVFTGEVQEAGSWRGLFVRTDNAKNKLDHVEIEYAGGSGFNSNDDKGAIVLYADGKLSLKNSTITDSANYGLNNSYAASLTFENNTITKSELAPLLIEASLFHQIDAASDLTGNGKDWVQTDDGNVDLGAEVTWQALSVPYFINNTLQVKGSSIVTVEEGADFVFAPDTGLSVRGSAAFAAQGSAEQKVKFRGEVEEKGSWLGLFFDTNDPRNILDHVEISHGGGGGFNSNDDRGSVILYADSKIKITNSSISQSKEYGINAAYSISDIEFTNNTVTACDKEPVVMNASLLHKLDAESDLTGNARDYVYVSRPDVVDTKESWKKLSVPYYVPGNTIVNLKSGADIIIEAGVEMRFGADAGLRVEGGSLSIQGTSDERVQMLGETEVAESWRGIFVRTNDTKNKFSYLTLKHGGSNSFNSNGDKGGIIVFADARVELEGVLIEDSGTCGIHITSRSGVVVLDGTMLDLALVTEGVCTPS